MNELVLLCPESHVHDLGDALEALDALSVSVEDADAFTDAEKPIYGEPGMPEPSQAWQRSKVTALFETQEQAQLALVTLKSLDQFEGCELILIQAVQPQDWVRLTQSQFKPLAISPTFWIVPSWHEVPSQAQLVIRLDPGLAFGTGTHPTTFMCLKWLSSQAKGGALHRVLDYGCGSGILAIGASLLGASEVDAVDIDNSAVVSTQANAQANQVALNVGMPQLARGTYNTVVANILSSPLKVLAPLLCAYVAENGKLILSGILERQAQELKDAYAPWVNLEVTDNMDGWVLMTATKSANDMV